MNLLEALMERGDLSLDEAKELIEDMKLAVLNGEDPQDVLQDYADLEPDYFLELFNLL